MRMLAKSVPAAAVVAGVLSLLSATAGGAATAIKPAPGAPDPRLMVITRADVGGAKVTQQHYYKDTDFPSAISYSREFDAGKIGSAQFEYLDTEAEVGTSAATTARFLGTIRRVFGTKAFAKEFAKEIEQSAGGSGLVKVTKVGRPRSLGIGTGSFDVAIVMSILGAHTDAHFTVLAVERALGALILVGEPGRRVPVASMARLAKLMAGRMSTALQPKNTVAPTIAGVPQVGQTLTASPGTWTGGSATFSYQWQRCDAVGANCADVSLATSSTYTLAAADAGATMRVAVTGRNGAGSTTATSIVTAVVTATGAPTSTSPPVVTGTPQVGQSLSATTGGWTGSPSAFAFQWQRCSASGTSCAAIPGATSGTYLLSSADQGSTVRVAVTATNALGSATAFSAPTAVVT